VEDEGPGIPGSHRRRVWEPFFQLDGSSTKAVGGLGIGMHLAKLLVEAQGGRVAADAGRSGGALIRITVPQQ
ncbi:MAG: sensor histidine kinase, partial [Actinomycetota bacterium]